MKRAVAMTVFCRTAKPEVWSLLVLVLSATTFSAPQEDLLYDGKMNPACVWEAETDTNGVMRPIPVVTDFGGMREVGGVRILSPRSWVNCCVRKASFYALNEPAAPAVLAEHVSFRPANTYG